MLVSIHKEDDKGNIFTLQNRNGLAITWNGKRLKVPNGFKSDGASVPRLFWRLVFPSCDTQALRAAIAHDYVYREHPEGWTKEEADNMFRDLLISEGMATWRAWMAWFGVHWFGYYSWEGDGENDYQ